MGVALADIAQHRDDEPALDINGNAEIDAADEPPLAGCRIVPGIERGLLLACRCYGANEADGRILAFAPIIDVGLLRHRGANHLGVGCRHPLRHGAAHAPQRLAGSDLGEAARGTLHIGARDRAERAARLHQIKINIELAGERAHRGKDCNCPRRRGLSGALRRRSLDLLAPELADDGAGVLARAFRKLHQRSANLDQIALAAKQVRNAAAPGRGHFDNRLVGFNRNERLIGDHVVALVDVPRHDLGLFEAFAEIRQCELTHGVSVSKKLRACFAEIEPAGPPLPAGERSEWAPRAHSG